MLFENTVAESLVSVVLVSTPLILRPRGGTASDGPQENTAVPPSMMTISGLGTRNTSTGAVGGGGGGGKSVAMVHLQRKK